MSEPSGSPARPWATTVCCLAGIGLLALPPFTADGIQVPAIGLFLGHFHPLVLHLPIGVFVLIVCQEIGAMVFRRGNMTPTADFPLVFGAWSAVVAALTGVLLYRGLPEDYAGNAVGERHLWGGLAFAAAALLTLLAKAWTDALGARPLGYRLLLLASVGVMGFTSHDGASLTHGGDFLTRHAPPQIRKWLGETPPADAAPADPVVYAEIIAPIFERRCVECHKPGKAKGKLRMDSHELLLKGGKEGPSIVPGSAAQSNLVIRMELPENDDEHMPPEDKPDVTADELLLIKWWLDQGADPARRLSGHEAGEEIQAALDRILNGPAASLRPPDSPE